jgi:hypothetical protein
VLVGVNFGKPTRKTRAPTTACPDMVTTPLIEPTPKFGVTVVLGVALGVKVAVGGRVKVRLGECVKVAVGLGVKVAVGGGGFVAVRVRVSKLDLAGSVEVRVVGVSVVRVAGCVSVAVSVAASIGRPVTVGRRVGRLALVGNGVALGTKEGVGASKVGALF